MVEVWSVGDLVRYDAHGSVFTARLTEHDSGNVWRARVLTSRGVHEFEHEVVPVGNTVSVVYGHSTKIINLGDPVKCETCGQALPETVGNLTAKSVESLLLGQQSWSAWLETSQAAEYVVTGLGIVNVVSTSGDSDSEDDLTVVVKVSDCSGDYYFRKEGYSSSYDGHTWESYFTEVTPETKTVYNRKKA